MYALPIPPTYPPTLQVVILVAVFVGAASAVVAMVTYWLMRERCAGRWCGGQRLGCCLAITLTAS